MTGRMRSPNYPSTPLEQAIDYIRQIYQAERTNAVDRHVAAMALGYSGISGRSATVLSNLIQYGLLTKTGKNEVRVTERAVEILYPDSLESYHQALQDAAREPDLFQRLMDKFSDGMPSSNALESYFMKEGFTDKAIPAAIKAFKETFSYLENTIERRSYGNVADDDVESQLNQSIERPELMTSQPQTHSRATAPMPNVGKTPSEVVDNGPDIRFTQKKIWLGGVISNQTEAQEIIATITALMPMLQKEVATQPADDDFEDLIK